MRIEASLVVSSGRHAYIGLTHVTCDGIGTPEHGCFSLSRFLTSQRGFDRARQHRVIAEGRILAKEELLLMESMVEEILPDGRFKVTLDNEHQIIAYTAGKMRKFRIRSIVGDRVHVEMTPYDLTKGRIVFREKTPGQGQGGKRRPRGFRR